MLSASWIEKNWVGENFHRENQYMLYIWVFPKIEVPPKWMVKIMEHPIFLVDDLGGRPTIFGNIHINIASYWWCIGIHLKLACIKRLFKQTLHFKRIMTKNTLTRSVNCILIPFFNWCHYQLSVFRFYFAKILPFPQGIRLFHRPDPSLDINHRPGAKCLKPLKQQKKHMYIYIYTYKDIHVYGM